MEYSDFFDFFQSPPTEQSLQHIFETRFRIIIESTRAYSRIYSNIVPWNDSSKIYFSQVQNIPDIQCLKDKIVQNTTCEPKNRHRNLLKRLLGV